MACWRSGFCALRAACFALVSALACVALPSGARAADTLYDVAKVSVDATDKDAVAAKAKGMKAAELDALNVVLKRLMPVSAYAQLPDLSQQDVEELVSSVSIRSEQNSATRYIASLDVSFNSEAVKQLLDSQNIPYSEARAEAISILPLVLDGGTVKSDGAWPQAWEDLDLAHSATPATILKPRPDLTAEAVKSVLGGDAQAFALMQADYSYAPLVIAVGEAGDGGKFVTRLVGADSVGPINYGHTDSFNGNAKEVSSPCRKRGRSRAGAANRGGGGGAAQRPSHGPIHRAQGLAGDQGQANAGRGHPGTRSERTFGARRLDHLRLCRLARQIAGRPQPKRLCLR
jgi:hypothetical protein